MIKKVDEDFNNSKKGGYIMKGKHEHEHVHGHEHTHQHSHEHTHDEMTHTHEHSHTHTHDHLHQQTHEHEHSHDNHVWITAMFFRKLIPVTFGVCPRPLTNTRIGKALGSISPIRGSGIK